MTRTLYTLPHPVPYLTEYGRTWETRYGGAPAFTHHVLVAEWECQFTGLWNVLLFPADETGKLLTWKPLFQVVI